MRLCGPISIKVILAAATAFALLPCWALASEPIIRLEPFVSGLNAPVSIQNANDGSGRLFVAELFGLVRVIRNGELLPTPFLDLTGRAVQEGEGGLIGLAFHPDYAENGRFFVLYTTGPSLPIGWTLSEFGVSPDNPDQALPGERIVLRMFRPSNIHHAGDLAFGPDGYLYISSGDGGPAGDPNKRGQDLNSWMGKILRIGVDGPGLPYTVPPDNPFVGRQDARGEIWAYGLRNPFRFGFDRLTGRLFVADVGSISYEEVNLVVKGGNYGWSILEGNHCFMNPAQDCDRQGKLAPIHEYGRGDGRAVIGGRVYRGVQATPLWGAYIFVDFVDGRIWALQEASGGVWERRDLIKVGFLPSVIGEDEQGELYVADLLGGNLFRIEFAWQEVFAQVADGSSASGTFQSVIQLANNQQQTVTGVLRFHKADGSPQQITLGEQTASEFPISLAPGSSRSLTTPGSSDPLFSGWAEVQSDRPLSGSVLFTFSEASSGAIHRAGVAGSQRGRTFTAPVGRDSAQGTRIGLAVANPSFTDTAHVQVVITGPIGVELLRFEVDLAPLWRGAAFIDELGNLPEDFQGTLRLTSDRDIAPTLLLTLQGLPSASLPLDR